MSRPKVTDSTTTNASRAELSREILSAFQATLHTWYQRNRRDLPWRRTRDPYAIALSEFMLQQTQVATATPYYERWLELFPTWRALAEAPIERILKAWEGLGYYQRARNLHKLAQAVAASPTGELPSTAEELESLPGIGPYTARAIASIAFGQSVGVLDGNVIRVLTRVFTLTGNVADRAVLQALWALAEALTAPRHADVHNQALMELGALVCQPRKPMCPICPLNTVCRGKSDPQRYPVKERTATQSVIERIAVIEKNKRWWCVQSCASRRLAEFWRFPDLDEGRMRAGEELARFKYTITNQRVSLTAHRAQWESAHLPRDGGRWLTREQIDSLPFGAAHRRIARLL